LERASGGRLVGIPMLPINGGVAETCAELERVAKQGARGVQVDAFPDTAGAPHYSDPVWEPLWSTLEEAAIPLSFHIQGPRGMQLRHEAGLENILWSSDYPHSDTTWPRSREAVAEQFADVPPRERDLIVWRNAARLYGIE